MCLSSIFCYGQRSSIHASSQLEWFPSQVNMHSKSVGGQQQLFTLERYTIPISIHSGLAYIHPIHVPSDHNLQTFPHVVFTVTGPIHGINLELLPTPDSADDQSLLQDSSLYEFGELKEWVVRLPNTFLDV